MNNDPVTNWIRILQSHEIKDYSELNKMFHGIYNQIFDECFDELKEEPVEEEPKDPYLERIGFYDDDC